VNRPGFGLLIAAVLAAAVSGAACKRQIGDDCKTATDCDPNGTKACDLSQPGGYCTVMGCDETTCPSEATCIRYFPTAFLTTPCNPSCEDVTNPDPDAGCDSVADGGGVGADGGAADGGGAAAGGGAPAGPRNDCTADEICLVSGVCAPRSTERRYCAKTCGSDGDCRDGYECRLAGREGSMALSSGVDVSISFCAPRPPAS
jgi:hypothetical protein